MQDARASRIDAAHAAELTEVRPLTSLRFVAALYVFVFHIHIRWPVAGGWMDGLLSSGAVGMSLFFMLSGGEARVRGLRKASARQRRYRPSGRRPASPSPEPR